MLAIDFKNKQYALLSFAGPCLASLALAFSLSFFCRPASPFRKAKKEER